MKTIPVTLFTTFATVFIISTFYKPYPYSYLVKLLPMLLLIVFVFKHQTKTTHKFFLTGLIFSAFGDFFLDVDRQNWFIYGLGSFFIAHLFYLRSFYPYRMKLHWATGPYLLYGLIMLYLLLPGLGELKIPVIAYMTVLLFMGIATLISEKSNPYLVSGGVLFVISDSLIGIHKFAFEIAYAAPLILITYYAAQLMLVKGMIQNQSKIDKVSEAD